MDGVHNVIRVLEEIENDKFADLDFFEGLACTGGCVGGPLVFENGFVAGTRINTLSRKLENEVFPKEYIDKVIASNITAAKKAIEPIEVLKLDDDFMTAMHMMEEIEEIYQRLPGLDCGSCGSPSCRTLAEDIVRGKANEIDCIFILKEKVGYLAEEMENLLGKMSLNKED